MSGASDFNFPIDAFTNWSYEAVAAQLKDYSRTDGSPFKTKSTHGYLIKKKEGRASRKREENGSAQHEPGKQNNPPETFIVEFIAEGKRTRQHLQPVVRSQKIIMTCVFV